MKTLSSSHVEAHTETRPVAFPLERREFHFATDQVCNGDNVILTVTGAASRAEAKRMLNDFLEDIERHGLHVS